MKSKVFYTTVLAIALMALTALPSLAQLRYQTQYSKSRVSGIITKLENSSDKFRRDFDRAMDNSRRNNTNAEDQYNDNVRDFENSLDELRREFNRTRSWWETRNEVQNVINDGQNVNQMMNQISFRRTLERQWNAMRNDLNTLADTYDLPGLNGGGWSGGNNGGWNGGNNGGWNNGSGTSTPPNWLQGTFYGTAPNGSQITMTFSNNGQVTSNVNGSLNYGTYNRGIITFGSNSARVSRTNGGIQTVSTSDRETIQFFRTNAGGGGVVNTGDRVPNWAIGTFRGQNPQNGGAIIMTINRDGSVYVTMDGGGSSSSGYLNGTVLTMGSNTGKLYRQGNGFRTVADGDGQTIIYVRN